MDFNLEWLLEQQMELDNEIANRKNVVWEDIDIKLQKQITALAMEAMETLRETNIKWWKDKKEIDKKAIKEEVIDILHFWLSICNTLEMNQEEIMSVYLRKHNINKRRLDD